MIFDKTTKTENSDCASIETRLDRAFWLSVASDALAKIVADGLELGFEAWELAEAIRAVQYAALGEIGAVSEHISNPGVQSHNA